MTNKTKRPKSLVVNVTIRVGIIISLCFIVLGFAMQKSIHHHFLDQDADELHVIDLTLTSALNRAISNPDSELLSITK